MNIISKSINQFCLLFILWFTLISTIFTANAYSSSQFETWGISRDKVKKDLILPDERTIEFTLFEKPKYKNKIMNMVKLILQNVDSKINQKIKIISTKTNPRKDFLLYKDQLFSIMKKYKSLSKKKLNLIVKKLSEEYGDANHNPGSKMDIYFISTEKTKIIVHYYIKTNKCEIYFYDSHLYHKLSSNEF